MTSVLESTFNVFRAHGITKIFGNPGSNEIPFLADLPADFDFVLGLHEQVVMGLAEGYSRATGAAALVNLHAASGTGNAMGALTNAQNGHTPLVMLAGQQVRRTVGQRVMLGNAEAATLPSPLVKYSHEPLSPQDVPRSLSQALLEATTAPTGPVYVSVPLDDWQAEALDSDALLTQRSVVVDTSERGRAVAEVAAAIAAAERVAIVFGPQVDAAAVQDAAVYTAAMELAERADASVFSAPSPDRCAFPTTHPNFAGALVPGIKSIRDALEGYDLVVVIGAPVFRYHRWEPSEYLGAGVALMQVTEDAGEATRAPFGRSFVADVASTVRGLAREVPDRGSRRGERGSRAMTPPTLSDAGMTGTQVLDALNELVRDDVVYVNETTSLDVDYFERVAIDRPGMYHFPASGGLGFGLPVAVGHAIGDPAKRVVATVGDGSANFGITALYTAARRRAGVVFVIMNNAGYGALAGFTKRMGASSVPGLELGEIDFVAIAEGYGVPASRVATVDQFRRAYGAALDAEGPVLIDVQIVREN
ncbi:benzoylformate decarboxylase [Leucobacter sp. gxy201]|uniref:benzoylformate decarboxylase n=1 Tax=Leucobacter sp. gxy201 TaxID=2957200 RepID=UPI003DA0BF84